MLVAYGLEAFTRDLAAIVEEQGTDYRTLVERAKPLLEHLLADMSWLPPQCYELPGDRGHYLVYRHPEGAYTIWSWVFGPRQRTRVHDHKSWGLVGVWRGTEHEEKFTRVDDGSRAEYAELRSLGTTLNRLGTVTVLVPPDDDIHRIWTDPAARAYSIHIYGRPLEGRRSRHYDLETGAVTAGGDDPLALLRAGDLRLSGADFKALLGLADASDDELVEEVRRRLARASAARAAPG